MIQLTSTQIKEKLEAKETFILDFYADWCGPCKMFKPMLERIAADYPAVNFVAVDIDENADFAAENKIRGVPTLLWYKGGQLVDTTVGVSPEKVLREKISIRIR